MVESLQRRLRKETRANGRKKWKDGYFERDMADMRYGYWHCNSDMRLVVGAHKRDLPVKLFYKTNTELTGQVRVSTSSRQSRD